MSSSLRLSEQKLTFSLHFYERYTNLTDFTEGRWSSRAQILLIVWFMVYGFLVYEEIGEKFFILTNFRKPLNKAGSSFQNSSVIGSEAFG